MNKSSINWPSYKEETRKEFAPVLASHGKVPHDTGNKKNKMNFTSPVIHKPSIKKEKASESP